MKPNINTLLVLLSCTIAGNNPPIFSKSNFIFIYNVLYPYIDPLVLEVLLQVANPYLAEMENAGR